MGPLRQRKSSAKQQPKHDDKLLYAFNARKVGSSTCFLCGARLGIKNRSQEDIFPLWLQKRFALFDKQIILLNSTTIAYRQLKMPCCKRCNNGHLSKVERAMQAAVKEGPEAVEAMDRTVLLIWLSKILYGLLYKEHFLDFDRRNPIKGRLIDVNTLNDSRPFISLCNRLGCQCGSSNSSLPQFSSSKHKCLTSKRHSSTFTTIQSS